MAIGVAASAQAKSSTAIGSSATAKGERSVAIGSVDMTTIPVREGVDRTTYNSITNTRANGTDSTAIGTAAHTGSDAVTVVGTKNNAINTTDYKIDLSQKSKDSLDKADTTLQTLTTSADGAKAQTLDKDSTDANFVNEKAIQDTAKTITTEVKSDNDSVKVVKTIGANSQSIYDLSVDATGTALAYKADGTNNQSVSLSQGLDFTSTENIIATVDKNGVVKHELNNTISVGGKDGADGQSAISVNGIDGKHGVDSTSITRIEYRRQRNCRDTQ